MPWYVVSYDIRGNGSEEAYIRIGNALRTTADWCKPLFSQWIINTPLSASEFVDSLFGIGAIDDDDGLIVLETNMRGQFRRIPSPAVEWLQNHINTA